MQPEKLNSSSNELNELRQVRSFSFGGGGNKSHLFFAWLFVIMVIAAVASGVYYWQISNNLSNILANLPVHRIQTANWNTYTNSQYGFELKIPQDWSTKAYGSEIEFISGKTKAAIDENKKNCSGLGTGQCNTEGPSSDFSFSNKATVDKDAAAYGKDKLSTKIINGLTFKTYPIFGLIPGINYELKNQDKVYHFAVYNIDQSLRVLSTFKFVDQQTTPATPQNLTYTDTSTGYQIDYPAGLQYRASHVADTDISGEEFFDPTNDSVKMTIYINSIGLKIADCLPSNSVRSVAGITMTKQIYCDQTIAYRFSGGGSDYLIVDKQAVYTDAQFLEIIKTFKFTK